MLARRCPVKPLVRFCKGASSCMRVAMKFVPMHELLRPAWQNGHAVPSFCAWNAEVTETILQVASDLQSPVILMSGPGEFPLNPPDTMARISRAVAEKYDVPAALHLDHGDSQERTAVPADRADGPGPRRFDPALRDQYSTPSEKRSGGSVVRASWMCLLAGAQAWPSLVWRNRSTTSRVGMPFCPPRQVALSAAAAEARRMHWASDAPRASSAA